MERVLLVRVGHHIPLTPLWPWATWIFEPISFRLTPSKCPPPMAMLLVPMTTSIFALTMLFLLAQLLLLWLITLPTHLNTSICIASAPKYLTGAQHFLADIYPDVNVNPSHLLVHFTFTGSKKTHANPIKRQLPLHVAHLEAFLQVAWTTGKYDDLLLFIVILSCCFYTCLWSVELIVKNDKSLWLEEDH